MECVIVLRIIRALVAAGFRASSSDRASELLSCSTDNYVASAESLGQQVNSTLMEENRKLSEENRKLVYSLSSITFSMHEDEPSDREGSRDLLG